MSLKLLFMGSPEWALPSLRLLHGSRHALAGVVSQPDQPAGRGRHSTAPAIARYAVENGFVLRQPVKIRSDEETLRWIESIAPDLIVVVAYGQILPRRLLDIPRLGCVNLHFSLLPRYRGAAPIQWALIRGESETGVTTFVLNEKIDDGPILLQRKVEIEEEDDATSLGHRLSEVGAGLLLETVDGLDGGSLKPVPQNATEATQAPILKKEDGLIDWSSSAKNILCKIRGMRSWPGAHTRWKDQGLKIHRARLTGNEKRGEPGVILSARDEGITLACGQGALTVTELQLAGGTSLTASAFLKGHRIEVGEKWT